MRRGGGGGGDEVEDFAVCSAGFCAFVWILKANKDAGAIWSLMVHYGFRSDEHKVSLEVYFVSSLYGVSHLYLPPPSPSSISLHTIYLSFRKHLSLRVTQIFLIDSLYLHLQIDYAAEEHAGGRFLKREPPEVCLARFPMSSAAAPSGIWDESAERRLKHTDLTSDLLSLRRGLCR